MIRYSGVEDHATWLWVLQCSYFCLSASMSAFLFHDMCMRIRVHIWTQVFNRLKIYGIYVFLYLKDSSNSSPKTVSKSWIFATLWSPLLCLCRLVHGFCLFLSLSNMLHMPFASVLKFQLVSSFLSDFLISQMKNFT